MNIALNSPSHAIETSLIAYSNNSNPYRSPSLPSVESPLQHPELSNHDSMDHLSSATSSVNEGPPPPDIAHEIHVNPTEVEEGQNHDRIDVDMDGDNAVPEPPPQPPPPPEELQASHADTAIETQATSDETRPVDRNLPLVNPENLGNNTNSQPPEPPADAGDESGDESSSDDEHNFWANFQEDTSAPGEEELRVIEAGVEKSALDHEHWEHLMFGDLDDPEHVVDEAGLVTWTLTGFNGTAGSPNKEQIMRSPSVDIGGYKWNIKLFPRGNEGTDYLSVYVECTGPSERMDTMSADEPKPVEAPWDVAAQIGCVMYNPEEPRIQTNEKGVHHFEKGSNDFGWVRFHGPWHEIHRRRHLQRKPILCNDTLAFTAYVRTVKEPTGALWWHPSTNMAAWDNLAKTGHRGFVASNSNAFIAALSAWLRLAPFQQMILSISRPNTILEHSSRPRHLFDALQKVIYAMHSSTSSSTGNTVSLTETLEAIRWYYYNREFERGRDVIEIWDVLRLHLNEEAASAEAQVEHEDVLKSFMTLRQYLDPSFLTNDESCQYFQAHSAQESLDQALRDRSKTSGLPEPFDSSQPITEPPLVLQIELGRQRYDGRTRKWKRLTHRISIDETVILKQSAGDVHYTLYGMIVHDGELGSDDYSTIIRPGGPSSKWMCYGGPFKGHLTYLTRKQAIEAHEGSSSSKPTAPVAYILIYVRSDRLSWILNLSDCEGPSIEPSEIFQQRENIDVSSMELVPVQVVDSSIFQDWSGPGTIDLWAPELYHSSQKRVLNFSQSPTNTLRDIQELIVTGFNLAGMAEQCYLWPLKLGTHPEQLEGSSDPVMPALRQVSISTTVNEICDLQGSCRLWLHIIPIESIPPVITPQNPPVDSAGETPASVPQAPPEVPESVAEIALDAALAAETSNVQTVSDPDVQMVPDNPPQLANTDSEDTVMGGTQDPEATMIEQPVAVSPQNSSMTDWDDRHIYFFVKRFDVKQQKLYGVASCLALKTERFGDILERHHLLPKEYDLRMEMIDAHSDIGQINPNATVGSKFVVHGLIVVIEEILSDDEQQELRIQGVSATFEEYIDTHFCIRELPSSKERRYVSYFGVPFIDASVKNGRLHGHGIKINVSGDAYVGDFVYDCYEGQGTMRYANGDVYKGTWDSGEPHGTGTMVYAKTGNTYVGGWKNGKRHGKGTMHFEVADEEMQLCKICYEEEMDALFYRCGHVAACDQCARQVSDCPVCRRPVDAVVKIYRT